MAKKAAPTVATALGVDDLAKEMDITPQTARLKLRNAGIKRTGRSYTWKNKTEMARDIKKMEATAAS